MIILKVLIIASFAPEVLTFRGDMIQAILNNEHDVVVVAPEQYGEELKKYMNVKYIQVYMKRTGRNPFQDLITFYKLLNIIKNEKPEIIFAYTIKPIIYGCIAARIRGIKNIYAMLSGLGSISRSNGYKGRT